MLPLRFLLCASVKPIHVTICEGTTRIIGVEVAKPNAFQLQDSRCLIISALV